MKALNDCIALCMMMTISIVANGCNNSIAEAKQHSFSEVADVKKPLDEVSAPQEQINHNENLKLESINNIN